jgi:hypothetical protein
MYSGVRIVIVFYDLSFATSNTCVMNLNTDFKNTIFSKGLEIKNRKHFLNLFRN